MNKFSKFTSQIPEKIITDVEQYICNDIALFKPKTYVTERCFHSDDFHIIMPSTIPPDTYINDILKKFDKGKIIAINPGDTMFCKKECITKQYLVLVIKPELVHKVAQEMEFSGEVKFLKLQNSFSRELIQVVKSFDAETKSPDSLKLMIDCLGVQITALLLREFKTNVTKYPRLSPDGDTYVSLAIEYIETFFSSNITIKDICSEINVSSFHFIRTFKQKTGVSPHQYLLNIRVEKAEELLRLRQYSMIEIAALCGFINPSHFSSTYKAIKGYSPSEYKKVFIISNSNFRKD